MSHMMNHDTLIVVAEASALRQMIADAVNEALLAMEARDGRPLSAIGAARLARKRTADVLAALESGALVGSRDGRAWRVQPRDVVAWREAGCPMHGQDGAE